MKKKAQTQEEYREQMKARAETLVCPYEDCENYAQAVEGNITFIRKYGNGSTQNLFRCMKCRRTFSERRGTAIFGCCLPEPTFRGLKTYNFLNILHNHLDSKTKPI
jgi:hypothetical protein